MPGKHAASIDLPEPGGPSISRLCPPAAAISRARLAMAWPRTSAMSGPGRVLACIRAVGRLSICWPLAWFTSPSSEDGARISSPSPAKAASAPLPSGQINPRPFSSAASAAGSTPATGCNCPSSASSPSATNFSTASAGRNPSPTSRPRAMGTSKCEPSFATSAGDKLTRIFFGGSKIPIDCRAARTRSRDSRTVLSGRPTMVNAGRPAPRCTCTSTGKVSIPWNATVWMRVTIAAKISGKIRKNYRKPLS